MRKASPRAEKMRPARILRALELAPRKLKPCASRKTHRQKMGRHLIRALNQDGLEVGSHRTKYTHVALKNGTSFGPSLFTWRQIQYLHYQLSQFLTMRLFYYTSQNNVMFRSRSNVSQEAKKHVDSQHFADLLYLKLTDQVLPSFFLDQSSGFLRESLLYFVSHAGTLRPKLNSAETASRKGNATILHATPLTSSNLCFSSSLASHDV